MSSTGPDRKHEEDEPHQPVNTPRRRGEDLDEDPADRRTHDTPRRHTTSEAAADAAAALAAEEARADRIASEMHTAPETDTTPHEERRAPEPRGRRTGDEDPTDDHVGGRRAGDVFRRFRQPLIGLGLAGLAIPMVQATKPADQPTEEPPDVEPADEQVAAAAAADTEEHLAGKIAETQEDQQRTQEVDAAVSRYDISRDLAEDIYDVAREHNIEPKLAYGLVKTESMFDERAVSHVGARGLTQVMPKTAAWLIPGTKTEDLYDRKTNLALGFRYLDQMIAKYDGDVRLALLAYNRGPGTVDKVLRSGGNPDNGYADKVLGG